MDQQQSAALVVLCAILKKRNSDKKSKKKCWVRPWINRRLEKGACLSLINELRLEDPQQYRNFFRMSAEQLEFITNCVGPVIVKQDTRFRKAITNNHFLHTTQ